MTRIADRQLSKDDLVSDDEDDAFSDFELASFGSLLVEALTIYPSAEAAAHETLPTTGDELKRAAGQRNRFP
jgi:hypothetical protein